MKTLIGKVNHYVAYEGGIKFSFDTVKTQKVDKEETDIVDEFSVNIPFEIWKAFKGSKVKVTIEKV